MNDIKIMQPENLLIYQEGYTPHTIEKLIVDNNLLGLRIFDHLAPLKNVDFLNDCNFLRGLSIATRYDHGAAYLKNLPNLIFFSTQVEGTSEINLSNQNNLQRLSLKWRKNIVGLENCEKLLRLGLVDFKETDLLKIGNLNSLQILSIKTSLIETVNGIDSLVNLKKIILGNCKKLTSVQLLNGLNNLEELELDICPQIKDFHLLTKLPSLKILHLLDCKLVDSLQFINNFPSLIQLSILGNTDIVDGNMEPAKRIERLSYYHRKHYNEKIATPEADEQEKRNVNKIKELWRSK